MSDPILEEESLISQDDIDKLLDASSLEEAEEKLDAPAVEEDPDMEDFGELSQDDIDSLLSGSDEPLAEDEDMEDDEAGELSQDDIDSLLGGADEPETDEPETDEPETDEPETDEPETDEPETDDAGELSQDDIDSLLGGGGDDDDVGELSQDDIDSLLGGTDEDDGDTELISQDDIDSLMNNVPEADDDEEDDDDELISMDDIQDIIGNADADDGAPEEEPVEAPDAVDLSEATLEQPDPPEEDGDPEGPGAADTGNTDLLDEPIGDGDAVAVNDCLITQSTMDDLIQNAPQPSAAPDTELTAEDLGTETEPSDVVDLDLPVDLGEAEDAVDLDTDDLGVSDLDAPDDDLDNLLDESGEAVDLNLDSESAGDVTQEDIDALLQESDDGDDFLGDDDDILISQDDIDTLLMAADQEDEDVLGDLLGDAVDDSMDDFEDQEVVSGDTGEEDGTEQVVLEERDEASEDEEDEVSERAEKIKLLLKSKLVLAAISVFLVLGISVPAVYFIFFSKKPVALPEKEMVPVAVEEPARDVSVASVSIEDEPAPVIRQSGTIVLTDFIVLASDLEKQMTYVVADISIDYSDQRAYHEINNNLSFYRDLIYEAIQTRLVSDKRNEVTEADLLWGVENSLKKVLPPRFIEKISFKTFRTS